MKTLEFFNCCLFMVWLSIVIINGGQLTPVSITLMVIWFFLIGLKHCLENCENKKEKSHETK